jgi:hypothetical protein
LVGDLERGKAWILRCDVYVESVGLVGGDHGGERLRKVVLGR